MCVICHAAKKRHMKREEVLEACRINSAGFFGLTFDANGERSSVRTLSQDDFVRFFDSVPDDQPFIMHARIPSYGPTSLDNVHGWEEDGIVFMHNMSLHNLDGFMSKYPDWKSKTDSEFFFRKVFIPYYRGLGKEAYADGRMHQDLYRLTDWICGTGNRFLFVMPDNRVIRFGTWVKEEDRREGGECAFYASNSSYKTYRRAWGKGGTATEVAGFSSSRTLDDYDDYDGYGCLYGETFRSRRAKESGKGREDEEGQVLRDVAGDGELAEIALEHMVVSNAAAMRASSESVEDPEDSVALTSAAQGLLEPYLVPEMVTVVEGGMEFTATCSDIVCALTVPYANALAKSILKAGGGTGYYTRTLTRFDAERHVKLVRKKLRVAASMLDVSFDWSAEDAGQFVTAFEMARTRTGKASMSRIRLTDLISPPGMTAEDSEEAVRDLLTFSRMTQAEINAELESESEASAPAEGGGGKEKG